MPTDQVRDVDAYERRKGGRSFGAIARELGFESAPAATEAFLRVLLTREPDEQAIVRAEEHARLDVLAGHVRADESLEPAAIERRLVVIERMRAAVDQGAPEVGA